MAYVTEWKDTDLGADGGSRASFAIYNYTPILQYHLNKDGADRLYWWINGGKITADPDDNGDFDKINTKSNFTVNFSPTNNGSTSKFIDGNGKSEQTITGSHNLNLITPFTPTISGVLGSTTTKPTGGTDTAFSVRMKFENRPVIGHWEGLDCTLSGTLYDNTFCKNLSSVSIDRGYASGTGGIVIKMSSATPALQRNTSEEIVCTNKTYTIPCFSGSRTYRLSSSYGTPPRGGENMVSVSMSGIKLYNDNLTISCSSLGAITSFTRDGKKLTWTKVSGATSYNIYVDDNATAYTNVTTNTWTIPDSLYYEQKHTYRIEVCDVISLSYSYKTASGYKKVNSSWQPIDYATYNCLRQINLTAKKGVNKATHANFTDVGVISAPVVTRTRNAPDKYTYTITNDYAHAGSVEFYYSEGKSGSKVSIGRTITFDNLAVGVKKDFYFWAKVTTGGKVWWSDGKSEPVTPSKLVAPVITGQTKSSINAYSISFNTVEYANSYNIYLNGSPYDNVTGGPVLVTGFKAAQPNTVEIEAVYNKNANYNNIGSKEYDSSYSPILTTPVLVKKDIKKNNVEQPFGDAGSKEILSNVVTQVDLTWKGIDNASGYVLYDDYRIWNDDTQKWETGRTIHPTQEPDKDTEYMQTTIYSIDTDFVKPIKGYHDYTLRAIAAPDETYNSKISNTIHLEQSFELPKPTITYVNKTTEFTILEPKVDEEKEITQEAIDNIDFYSVQLVPAGTNYGEVLFRSFTPDKYPSTYSFYDMIKDLRQSVNFIGSVFSRSYNAFYFHPSEESDVKFSVSVIKLKTPHDLIYDPIRSTISWNGDANATSYDVFLKSIKSDNWVKYNLPAIQDTIAYTKDLSELFPEVSTELAAGVYSLYIVARRDNNNRIQPIYLDSEISEIISFGKMITPTNFGRIENKFYWDSVGADRYVFYEWIRNEEGKGGYDILYDNNKPYYVPNDNYLGMYDLQSLVTADGGATELYLGMTSEDLYRPTEGKHYYSVMAHSELNGVPYASKHSSIIEVDVKYLEKLNPYFDNSEGYVSSVVKWDGLEDEVFYDTRVNGTSEKDPDAETEYTLDKDEVQPYKFKVRAISTVDKFLYQTSEFSEEIVYNVYRLNRPNISLTKIENEDGSKKYLFTWPRINNATKYFIHINKNGVEDIEFTIDAPPYDPNNPNKIVEFEYPAFEGLYSIYVISKNDLQLRNPKYVDSDMSNMRKFGVLGIPQNIKIEDNVISWDANPLVDYYEIYNFETKYAETDRNKFEIDVSTNGTYRISVVAVSLEDDIFPSKRSDSVGYLVKYLDAPSSVRIEEIDGSDYLTWEVNPEADGYRVYIDDELSAITSDTKLNLTKYLAVRAGILKFYVIAYSNKKNLLDSPNSNFVMKRIEKSKKFNIVIERITYDQIQLPFSMNFTLDESLDTASVTLAYIDVEEPFERLTPADILIYETEGACRRFPMVIEKDEVLEVKIGDEIKYKHNLQLIERTIILQNEIIPDFSVSSSARNFVVRDDTFKAKVSPSLLGNTPFKTNQCVGWGTYDEIRVGEFLAFLASGLADVLQDLGWFPDFDLSGIDMEELKEKGIPTGVVWFQGVIPKGEIKNLVPKNINPGENFILPIAGTHLNCVCFSVKQILNWILNVIGLDGWDDLIGTGVGVGSALLAALGTLEFWKKLFKKITEKALKVVKAAGWIIAIIAFLIEYIIYMIKIACGVEGYSWPGLLEKLMTTDLSIIGDCFYTDEDWAYPARNFYVRNRATGSVELIRSFDAGFTNINAAQLKYAFPNSGNYDLIMEIPDVNYQDLYKRGLIDFESSIIKDGALTHLPTSAKMMYGPGGKDDKKTFWIEWQDINVRKTAIDFQYKKISEVLEKVAALTNDKYIIDPAILTLTSTLNCPDMTFSNGNYLYDVLEEIGREFYGIPRLLEDNIITFDILDTNTSAERQLTFWTPDDVLGNEYQDLDQVASGFISNVSNMIPDEDYTVFPAPDMWVSARSYDTETAATYIETMAIAVDKPIYKVGKVFVKNAIREMLDTPIDITNYVYESTVYNSLNNNPAGKGLALCWKQGDKFIFGIGQIPGATKFRAALGLSPSDYVIQKIVEDCIDKNFNTNKTDVITINTPADMLFQVEYQGYTDTMLYIENPDKKKSIYSMYNVFNQEDNTVSNTRFGDGALTVLKRHNTTMIQKEYQSYSLLRLPLLGSSTTIRNDPYYIDNLSYEFNNGYTKAICNFSRNYNKINPRTAINSEYRQYELRSDNVVGRSINFNEYCMIGNKENDVDNITSNIVWTNILKDSLEGKPHTKPECFYINCYNDLDLNRIPYTTVNKVGLKPDGKASYGVIEKQIEGIALPVSYNRIGCSVSFSANMVDNFTAGYTLKKEDENNANKERIQGFVRYVGDDVSDQTPYMRITLGAMSSYIKNFSRKEDGVTVTVSDTFPGVPWLDQPAISLNDVPFTKFFKVYKDQREAFKFNYQMHFVSNRDDLFIHKGLIQYLFKHSTLGDRSVKPVLVGFENDVNNKDLIYGPLTTVDGNLLVSQNSILFDKFVATNNYKGLAVVWPDTKEILLEIRRPVTKGETVSVDPIYFNFTNKIKR